MGAHKVKIKKATDALLVRYGCAGGVERTCGLIRAKGNQEPRSVSHPISHIGEVRLNAAIAPRLTVTNIEEPFEKQQGTEESLGTE
jgi:hypothetical protein